MDIFTIFPPMRTILVITSPKTNYSMTDRVAQKFGGIITYEKKNGGIIAPTPNQKSTKYSDWMRD